MTFKLEVGDWTAYRRLPNLRELDLHYSKHEGVGSFHEHMHTVREKTLVALESAQAVQAHYLLIRHGSSTSGRGRMSSRSVVRGLMRSKEATPFIVRRQCIQHPSVFVAAIRPASPDQPISMLVDVFDSTESNPWCLVVRSNTPIEPLIEDLRTGLAALLPLSLRVAGIQLGALVESKLAQRIAYSIATQGGSLHRKNEIIESVPESLARYIRELRNTQSKTKALTGSRQN